MDRKRYCPLEAALVFPPCWLLGVPGASTASNRSASEWKHLTPSCTPGRMECDPLPLPAKGHSFEAIKCLSGL